MNNHHLDMALDDILIRNRRGRGVRGAGLRGGRRGSAIRRGGSSIFPRTAEPLRVRPPGRPSSLRLAKSFLSRGSNVAWRQHLFEDVVQSVGIDTGTKLYLSNLDYRVSNEDIKELFSEVGDLKSCAIHYYRSGRSKGTAEVVYSRQRHAVAAMKQYNNVQLDGKRMKIELIGTNLLPPIAPSMNGASGFGRGRRMIVMTPGFTGALTTSTERRRFGSGSHGWGFGFRGFRGRGRGRGRGRRPPIRGRKAPTVDELNADLEKYHQDVSQPS